jgi:rubrerythrin
MTGIYGAMRQSLKQNSWNLDAVLPLDYQIPTGQFEQLPLGVHDNFCRLLGRDVYSEGDARSLYTHLTGRANEFSPAFLTMLDLWLADELKHYEALRRIYHCISGVGFGVMDQQFSDRIHEIEPIEPVLVDEFTVLVTMMFDEIGSVYSYRRDLWEYYQHYGSAIRKVAHHLIRDEGMHFNNAAELLLAQHPERLGEVAVLLSQISALEKGLKKYHKTFFLDHAQEQYRFPPQFNAVLIRLILARLGLGERPEAWELHELWQWVPEGYRLVPILAG